MFSWQLHFLFVVTSIRFYFMRISPSSKETVFFTFSMRQWCFTTLSANFRHQICTFKWKLYVLSVLH